MPDGTPVDPLPGFWDFHYASHPLDVPEGFATGARCDTKPIAVPSHWQLEGYGAPQYTNTEYPFPVDPPRAPRGPVGSYRCMTHVPSSWLDAIANGGRVVLRTEGIDSFGELWCNGTLLGATVGSRLPHEFDVTDLVHGGDNLIAVHVHQWSATSYVEDQDMWWLSGIFRPVTLRLLPPGLPTDVRCDADFDPATGQGILTVTSDVLAEISLPQLDATGITGEPITVGAVQPWTAETPQLYDVHVTTPAGTVTQRVGFRRIDVSDGVFRVNGRRTVLRGVNRHDFHPDRGRALTREDLLADVLVLKRNNINAVRTSHYPPHPDFLDLCDEFGLYVIDECDLETHGFVDFDWRRNPSADPQWRDALVDRMRRTVTRDRNHACVVMWSLGNEAGTGSSVSAMAAWCRDADPSRPIHYEPDQDTADTDVWSQMYPGHDAVTAIADRAEPALPDAGADAARRGKPYILCEFAHAMGNGAGATAEYLRDIERSDRMIGAFVWEMFDHGLRTSIDGRPTWGYGGDFGETLHSGNFCCDGLLFPDRTPSPAMLDWSALNAPARITVTDHEVHVHNIRDHRDTTDLSYRWSITDESGTEHDGPLTVPPVASGSTVTVPLPKEILDLLAGPHAELAVTVHAYLTNETAYAPAGFEVSTGTVEVPATADAEDDTAVAAAAPVPTARTLTVGPAEIDPATGMLTHMFGNPLAGPSLTLWRAPTDNDEGGGLDGDLTPVATHWSRMGLHRLMHELLDLQVDDQSVSTVVRSAPADSDIAVLTRAVWSAEADVVQCHMTCEPQGEWAHPVARVGWTFQLPDWTGDFTWWGHGPDESYVDSRNDTRLGLWRRSLEQLHTPYVRPQENGQRSNVRWGELRAADAPDSLGLRITADRPIGMTVRRHSIEQLAQTKHDSQLAAEHTTWWHLDVAQHGLGSAACGPQPLPQHTLMMQPQALTLRFTASG